MFAKHREECAKEAAETYLKYIQSNKKRLWADRDILQQLLKEKYITEKDLDVLLEEAGNSMMSVMPQFSMRQRSFKVVVLSGRFFRRREMVALERLCM